MVKLCPKCKAKMDRWVSVGNKRAISYECTKCDYCWYSKESVREFDRAFRDVKEGRTYLWCCGTSRNRCKKSKEKLTICHSCATEQAKRWYRIGVRDGRKG